MLMECVTLYLIICEYIYIFSTIYLLVTCMPQILEHIKSNSKIRHIFYSAQQFCFKTGKKGNLDLSKIALIFINNGGDGIGKWRRCCNKPWTYYYNCCPIYLGRNGRIRSFKTSKCYDWNGYVKL